MGDLIKENQNEPTPTPKVQCHSRNEAKELVEILEKIKQGKKIKQIIDIGAIVYVHLE